MKAARPPRIASRSGTVSSLMTPYACFAPEGVSYPMGQRGFTRPPRLDRQQQSCKQRPTRHMPWNDNANPGPWGSPPSGEDGGRKDPPSRRPGGGNGGGPRGPRPDLGAGMEQLSQRLSGLL